jgi:hypothetical protein
MDSISSPWLVIFFVGILLAAIWLALYVVIFRKRDADKKNADRLLQAVPPNEQKTTPIPAKADLFRTILQEARKDQEEDQKSLAERMIKQAEADQVEMEMEEAGVDKTVLNEFE